MIEYKLSRPIHGIETINIDVDELSMADYRSATVIKNLIKSGNASQSLVDAIQPRLDSELRIALAWVAAIKHDNRLSINDILSLPVTDGILISEAVLTSFCITD